MAATDINEVLVGNDQLAAYYSIGKAGNTEGAFVYGRSSSLGEQLVQNLHGTRTPAEAREGSVWVATNTQGTAVTSQNVSAFGATTPALILVNNNPAGGAWIYPTRLRFSVTAVGTSSTNWQSRWLVDTGNRYSSGGSQFTPTNPNLQVGTTKTGALFYVGAITATAATASRTVHQSLLRSVIPVANDQVTFDWGNTVISAPGQAEDGTTVLFQVVPLPMMPLPPQSSLLWYEWGASQGAARSFDQLTLEYIERAA